MNDIKAITKGYLNKVVGVTPFIRAAFLECHLPESTINSHDLSEHIHIEFGRFEERQGGCGFLLDSNEGWEYTESGCCFEQWLFIHPLDLKRIDGKVTEALKDKYDGKELIKMIDLYMNPKTTYPLNINRDNPLEIFY